MFFRRKPAPTVTNDAYRRWLRAQRPPWVWFLGLSELEQEQLALLGDEHAEDLVTAVGYALKHADLVEVGVNATAAAAGDATAEETLARQVAAGLLDRILARREPAPARAAAPITSAVESMGGLGQRRQDRAQDRQAAKDAARSLLGRAPDPKAST